MRVCPLLIAQCSIAHAADRGKKKEGDWLATQSQSRKVARASGARRTSWIAAAEPAAL